MKNLLVKSFSTKIITQMLINGKFVNSVSGKTFDTNNPATEQVLAKVQEGGEKDINIAVNAARRAFDEGPWRKMSAFERGKLIYKLADLMEKNADELALLESLNNGKPRHIARRADLNSAINMFRYYAGFSDKVHGKTIPINGDYFCYTRHEPVGVCGQILPWNFPIAAVAAKLAPALAMGCTSVIKPAEQTPLTALRIGELIMEAGFPEGVVNIVPGFGNTGEALTKHHLVDKIAFTGSTEVGLKIMRNSHPNNLKRISLELGGKNPLIIMDDADLDAAIKQAQGSVFFNSGQICVQSSRIYVHENIFDEYLKRSIELTKNKTIGDPMNESTDQGPLVDESQFKKYQEYIVKGTNEGAQIHCGGKVLKGKGYFVEPTIFTNVKENSTLYNEELFCPIMCLFKFKTLDEVIQRANNSAYGLVSGIFTQNMDTAMKAVNSIRTGTVYVNCYGIFDASAPFGGFKNSGIGKEHSQYGLDSYSEVKNVVIKRPEDSLP